MVNSFSGSVKDFKRGIIILRKVQDYPAMPFAICLSNPKRLILKRPFRPGIFAPSLLVLILSCLPVPLGQGLSLAVHDER